LRQWFRTWDGLGDGGVEGSRTVQLLNALWPVKFGSRHINSANREIQIRPQRVKPGQYRGGLVHSKSATHSRDLVPATGDKVAHAIAEREARDAGDQNHCYEVRH
jgi:hypothetical protein